MGIDADTAIAGNQAFRWVGTAALTGAGQLGYFTSGGNTIIRGSNDADAASEFEIQLTGIKTLTVGRFLPVTRARVGRGRRLVIVVPGPLDQDQLLSRLGLRYWIALLQPDDAFARCGLPTRFQAFEPTVKVADHHSVFRAFEGMGRTETSEHGGSVPSVP